MKVKHEQRIEDTIKILIKAANQVTGIEKFEIVEKDGKMFILVNEAAMFLNLSGVLPAVAVVTATETFTDVVFNFLRSVDSQLQNINKGYGLILKTLGERLVMSSFFIHALDTPINIGKWDKLYQKKNVSGITYKDVVLSFKSKTNYQTAFEELLKKEGWAHLYKEVDERSEIAESYQVGMKILNIQNHALYRGGKKVVWFLNEEVGKTIERAASLYKGLFNRRLFDLRRASFEMDVYGKIELKLPKVFTTSEYTLSHVYEDNMWLVKNKETAKEQVVEYEDVFDFFDKCEKEIFDLELMKILVEQNTDFYKEEILNIGVIAYYNEEIWKKTIGPFIKENFIEIIDHPLANEFSITYLDEYRFTVICIAQYVFVIEMRASNYQISFFENKTKEEVAKILL